MITRLKLSQTIAVVTRLNEFNKIQIDLTIRNYADTNRA